MNNECPDNYNNGKCSINSTNDGEGSCQSRRGSGAKMITRIHLIRSGGIDGLQIYIRRYDTDKRKSYIGEVKFRELEECEIHEPSAVIKGTDMKLFLTELLTEIKDNGLELNIEAEGELKATKVHLEDMRNMTQKLLNKVITEVPK